MRSWCRNTWARVGRETHFALPGSLWLSREVERAVISALSKGLGRFGLVVAEAESGDRVCRSVTRPRYRARRIRIWVTFTFTCTDFPFQREKIYGSFD